MRQQDLAEAVDCTQASVSAWVNGQAEPVRKTVYAIEKALDLSPGALSRSLGYVPVETLGEDATVEEVVTRSDLIGNMSKKTLIELFRALAMKDATGLGRDEAAGSEARSAPQRPIRQTARPPSARAARRKA